KFKFMIKSIKLLSIGFLGALAMSSCSKEDPTPEPKQKFTIEFSAGDNGTVDPKGSQTGEEGTEITSTASPTGTFKFAGWFKTDDLVNKLTDSDDWTVKDNDLTVKFTANTANKNFIAKFAEILYTVKFEAEKGGSVDKTSGESSVGSYVHSTATAYSTHWFENWYDSENKIIDTKDKSAPAFVSEDGLTLYVKISEAVKGNTYKAKFTPVYTVNFEATNGGEVSTKAKTDKEGALIASEATTEFHYTLDGWYNDEGKKITTRITTSDVYVSENGSILYVKSLPGVNKKTFTAKFIYGGSRIYVDGSGDLATLKLTQDPKKQIAFFQFGSVVAWSNTGNLRIEFNPTTTVSSWDQNWNVGGSFPDHTVSNLNGGKGDPCRLVGLTQQQIKSELSAGKVPDNKTWRMPTADENEAFGIENSGMKVLDGIKGYYMGPGATYEGTDGEFFPITGRLATKQGNLEDNNWGYYWSKTTNVNKEGLVIQFQETQITWKMFNEQSSGIAVRCVPQQ
ncbi:MAG: InlB B-repeat-containing protein, partial [Phocaeicola sp.]